MPAEAIVFVDESQQTVDDCVFKLQWNNWGDSPAARHNRGCIFSFADGHVERWQWLGINQELPGSSTPQNTAQWRDLRRLQAGIVVTNLPSNHP